jgi:SAM-dependent methyltransferase
MYQFTYYYSEKVIHKNLEHDKAGLEMLDLLNGIFRQAILFTREADYQILISKKNKVKILKKKASKESLDLSHNRRKKYILQDGEPIDFLIRLGVMTKEGKVSKKRYDKFRQLNRFLELVEDIIPRIKKDGRLNIIDFGCGKSYLTFALYYYLVEILKFDVNIIGLDLKEDVINFCNQVAKDLDYKGLYFIHVDIKDYDNLLDVDMVITLHACDTATDAALIKAIDWKAKVILSVPCCQHEFYDKIQSDALEPMLKHGIIRERLSALVTDSLRGQVLEIMGYQVQLLEFIDMEHTPKNIMIRAIKSSKVDKEKALNSYKQFKEFWGLEDLYIEEGMKGRIL